jgi:hypothetical protein
MSSVVQLPEIGVLAEAIQVLTLRLIPRPACAVCMWMRLTLARPHASPPLRPSGW